MSGILFRTMQLRNTTCRFTVHYIPPMPLDLVHTSSISLSTHSVGCPNPQNPLLLYSKSWPLTFPNIPVLQQAKSYICQPIHAPLPPLTRQLIKHQTALLPASLIGHHTLIITIHLKHSSMSSFLPSTYAPGLGARPAAW